MEWLATLYTWFFNGNSTLLYAFGLALSVLILTGVLCCFLRNLGVYFAVAVLVFGGVFAILAWQKIPLQTTLPFFVLLASFAGLGYLITVCCFSICERIKKKRMEVIEQSRRLQFASGQDNSFIRARLNVLCSENGTDGFVEETGEELKLRFVYAKKLLGKLRGVSLSVAEKLEVEEMEKILGLYRQKETFVSEDVRLISETFSRVLKLSAKYGV